MTQVEAWTRRFGELTADAGRAYDRSLRRYNELLERVARGDLAPEQVQGEFRAYVGEQSAAATRDLVEASVGLLAGLLYLEATYREALLDGLIPSEGPVPPPPAPSSVDVTNWFQALAKYAAEQSARAIARQQRLVERIGAGEVTAAQVQEHGRRYLASQAPGFIDEVVQLGLTFAGRMQRSSATLADGLYDRVLGPDPAAPATREPVLMLELSARTGEVAAAELVVENTRAETAVVTCRLSELVSRSGGDAVPAGEVTPAAFTLAPGASRDVAVRIPLDAERFTAGADYFGLLRVTGAGDREMLVQVIIRAEESPRDALTPL